MNSFARELFCRPRHEARERPLVLVFSFDFLSHYLRCLQLANRFRDEVDFVFAHTKRYHKWIQEAGFPTFAFDDTDAEIILEYSTRFDFSWMSVTELDRVMAQQIEIIKRLQPDCVLGDASMTLNMAAEFCGVPCVKVVNGYMTKYYQPGRSVPRVHPAHRVLQILPSPIRRVVSKVGEAAVLRLHHASFAELRKRYALSSRSSILDELEGDKTLVCDLPELFPQKNLPANYAVVGPLFHRATREELELKQTIIALDKPLVIVSLGSTGKFEHFKWLEDKRFAKYTVLATGRSAAAFRAPHIISRAFVDHEPLLPLTRAVICHGGNGTIYQALAHAVPVLAHTNFFEQEYNMQQVERNKLGAELFHTDLISSLERSLNLWVERRDNHTLRQFQNYIQNFVPYFAHDTDD